MIRILMSISFIIPLLAFGQEEDDTCCSQIAIQRYKGDLDEKYPMKHISYSYDTVKVDLGDSGVYEAYNPMYSGKTFYLFLDGKPSSTDLDMDLLDDGILEGTITFKRKYYQIQYEFAQNFVVKESKLNSKGTKVDYYYSVPIDSEGRPLKRPQRTAYQRVRRRKMVREVVFCKGKFRGRLKPMKIEENE